MKKLAKLDRRILFMFQAQYEGTQWGRPGPGGSYWRQSAVTGQRFFDKMVTILCAADVEENLPECHTYYKRVVTCMSYFLLKIRNKL